VACTATGERDNDMQEAWGMQSVRGLTILGAVMLVLAAGGGCRSTGGETTTVGQKLDDAAITAQVKGRLAAAEAETLANVNVDSVNGVVYLNGTVDNAQLKTQAETIARTEEGVQRVVNNLQVMSK
jgi:hyperosmotically inducible protein